MSSQQITLEPNFLSNSILFIERTRYYVNVNQVSVYLSNSYRALRIYSNDISTLRLMCCQYLIKTSNDRHLEKCISNFAHIVRFFEIFFILDLRSPVVTFFDDVKAITSLTDSIANWRILKSINVFFLNFLQDTCKHQLYTTTSCMTYLCMSTPSKSLYLSQSLERQILVECMSGRGIIIVENSKSTFLFKYSFTFI